MRRVALAVLALVLAVPVQAAEFALTLPVTTAPGSDLQRLEVPAAALAASKSPDLADLRLFDARGDALPFYRVPAAADSRRADVDLPGLPILGRPGALKVTGVGLTLDERDGARVARIDGTVDPDAPVAVLGTLFDTRTLADPVRSLTLDAALPVGQPVLMVAESSADLRQWQVVAERMLYRAAASDAPPPVELGNASLKDRYLRLRWRAETPLVTPITVRSARFDTENIPSPAWQRVGLQGGRLQDAHDIRLTPPFATRIAAIDVALPRTGMLVPVTIWGRAHAEAPWVRLGDGTVFRLSEGGQERAGPPLWLSDGPTAELRIAADDRTPGFAGVPDVTALLPPTTIAFVASGFPPYRLAVGKADAQPGWQPLPGGDDAFLARLQAAPLARAATAPAETSVSAAPPADWPVRRLLLWGVLLLGVASLAGIVVLLRRG
jgi:hypothetical protein